MGSQSSLALSRLQGSSSQGRIHSLFWEGKQDDLPQSYQLFPPAGLTTGEGEEVGLTRETLLKCRMLYNNIVGGGAKSSYSLQYFANCLGSPERGRAIVSFPQFVPDWGMTILVPVASHLDPRWAPGRLAQSPDVLSLTLRRLQCLDVYLFTIDLL